MIFNYFKHVETYFMVVLSVFEQSVFFLGGGCTMQKLAGQGSNPSHRCNLRATTVTMPGP